MSDFYSGPNMISSKEGIGYFRDTYSTRFFSFYGTIDLES